MKTEAIRRREARPSFYVHLFIFALINSLLVGSI